MNLEESMQPYMFDSYADAVSIRSVTSVNPLILVTVASSIVCPRAHIHDCSYPSSDTRPLFFKLGFATFNDQSIDFFTRRSEKRALPTLDSRMSPLLDHAYLDRKPLLHLQWSFQVAGSEDRGRYAQCHCGI
jgi:hypothetical protein